LSFSAPRSRLLPPLETPAPLRAASKCRDAIPSTGRGLLPELSEPVGESVGTADAGVVAWAPVSSGGLEGDVVAVVVAAAAGPGVDEDSLSGCLPPRADLPLLGEDEGVLASDGGFPDFTCAAEPAGADAF
jgi:hypothetical protein